MQTSWSVSPNMTVDPVTIQTLNSCIIEFISDQQYKVDGDIHIADRPFTWWMRNRTLYMIHPLTRKVPDSKLERIGDLFGEFAEWLADVDIDNEIKKTQLTSILYKTQHQIETMIELAEKADCDIFVQNSYE